MKNIWCVVYEEEDEIMAFRSKEEWVEFVEDNGPCIGGMFYLEDEDHDKATTCLDDDPGCGAVSLKLTDAYRDQAGISNE